MAERHQVANSILTKLSSFIHSIARANNPGGQGFRTPDPDTTVAMMDLLSQISAFHRELTAKQGILHIEASVVIQKDGQVPLPQGQPVDQEDAVERKDEHSPSSALTQSFKDNKGLTSDDEIHDDAGRWEGQRSGGKDVRFATDGHHTRKGVHQAREAETTDPNPTDTPNDHDGTSRVEVLVQGRPPKARRRNALRVSDDKLEGRDPFAVVNGTFFWPSGWSSFDPKTTMGEEQSGFFLVTSYRHATRLDRRAKHRGRPKSAPPSYRCDKGQNHVFHFSIGCTQAMIHEDYG